MGGKKGKFKYLIIGFLVLIIVLGKSIIMDRINVKENPDVDSGIGVGQDNQNPDDDGADNDNADNDDLPGDSIVIPKPPSYTKDDDGKYYSEEPGDVLVVINKKIGLSKNFKPEDLVIPKVNLTFQNSTLKKEAAEALEKLFVKAHEDGIDLTLRTGYRSYDHQSTIYNNSIQNHGIEYTNQFVALPGHSEHQTGWAADLASLSEGHTLSPEFGQTKAGIWIEQNCAQFGFIIRYPKDKENITGYSYEPWHIRYVGVEYAKYITDKKITLEEFFGI